MHKDRTKVVSFFLFLFGLICILLTDNRAVGTAHGFSFGPPAAHTGAPLAEGGFEPTCTECHQTGFFSGAQLTIDVPSDYVPGHTYLITVTHSTDDDTRRRWGFQLTALTSSLDRAGDFQDITGLTQVLFGGKSGLRQYIEHTISSSQDGTFEGQQFGASWTVAWIAPATNVGPVTFYASGNQANGNGAPSGDQIYQAQVTLN